MRGVGNWKNIGRVHPWISLQITLYFDYLTLFQIFTLSFLPYFCLPVPSIIGNVVLFVLIFDDKVVKGLVLGEHFEKNTHNREYSVQSQTEILSWFLIVTILKVFEDA